MMNLTMINIENISSIKFEKKKLVINKFIQKKTHENRRTIINYLS